MSHQDTAEMLDVWDAFHPADDEDIADEFEGEDDDLASEAPPEIPSIDKLPDVVDYSTRAPGDFVLSGPLGEGKGVGRHFDTLEEAAQWAVSKYGKNRVGVLQEQGEFRWALLIKKA
jgi:hypothetical protein